MAISVRSPAGMRIGAILLTLFVCYWLLSSEFWKCSSQAETDWKAVRVDLMTAEEIFEYVHWTNSSACRVPFDFGGVVTKWLKFIAIDGQKTVCMDPEIVPVSASCIVYSFGINNEWSFDRTFEQFGCDVYAFDPSMNMKDNNFTRRIHFYQLGISNKDNDHGVKNWKLRTLDSIYKMLEPVHGPKVIDYLKIDVESAEWDALPQILRTGMLDKVRQLALEIHFEPHDKLETLRYYVAIIKSLEDYGMVRFTSRSNILSESHVDILNRIEFLAHELAWYNPKLMNS